MKITVENDIITVDFEHATVIFVDPEMEGSLPINVPDDFPYKFHFKSAIFKNVDSKELTTAIINNVIKSA